MNKITCDVRAETDNDYAGDGGIWRGHLNYSNGTSIPFKAAASFSHSNNPVVRLIFIVNASKTYRRRVPRYSMDDAEDTPTVFREMIDEIVRDFWPQTKCPFEKEIHHDKNDSH